LVLERVASATFRADMTNISMRFVKYRDKTFSFTDCSSVALMERIGIKRYLHLMSISRNTEVSSYYHLNREFKSGVETIMWKSENCEEKNERKGEIRIENFLYGTIKFICYINY